MKFLTLSGFLQINFDLGQVPIGLLEAGGVSLNDVTLRPFKELS